MSQTLDKATTSEARLQELFDRQDIAKLTNRLARGLDRHDEALVESVFWPDGQINLGPFSGPPSEFAPWASEAHAKSTLLHQHHITTQNIDIDGDTAHVETYVIVMSRNAEKVQAISGARYIDRAERRDGEWRLALRVFVGEMRLTGECLAAADFIGRWDREDISYQRPLPRR